MGAGFALIGGNVEPVARFGQRAEAEDFRRGAGFHGINLLALVVNERPNPSCGVACDDVVADGYLSVYDEQGGDGAALAVQLRLDNYA